MLQGDTYAPSFGYQIDTIDPEKLEFSQESCGGRRKRVEALEIGRAGPCLLKEISHNSGYSQGRMESRHLWVDVVHDNSLTRMAQLYKSLIFYLVIRQGLTKEPQLTWNSELHLYLPLKGWNQRKVCVTLSRFAFSLNLTLMSVPL